MGAGICSASGLEAFHKEFEASSSSPKALTNIKRKFGDQYAKNLTELKRVANPHLEEMGKVLDKIVSVHNALPSSEKGAAAPKRPKKR